MAARGNNDTNRALYHPHLRRHHHRRHHRRAKLRAVIFTLTGWLCLAAVAAVGISVVHRDNEELARTRGSLPKALDQFDATVHEHQAAGTRRAVELATQIDQQRARQISLEAQIRELKREAAELQLQINREENKGKARRAALDVSKADRPAATPAEESTDKVR